MSNPHAAAPPAQPIRLYRHPLSGHAHRVELFLSLLSLPFEKVDVDLFRGEQKRPEFLAKNPFGEVPVIEDGAIVVADSNAILVYLARRYDASGQWLPLEPVACAEVQRWLSVAAGQLHNGPAVARLSVLLGRPREPKTHEIAAQLFAVMDAHLARQRFLASNERPTLADVALYTYTALAPVGDIALEPYPNVRAWLGRVEALPGFVKLQGRDGAATS
jgi:glutathione S-transferase